ncbi:hypothetical protein CEXT_171681 [Caerostris extrusa]|uniref:Uncharacterized protein n=1 Tax=Caerostris extrusa TaxID=172846 RepID=A0AAV4QVP4_CAEEX|nr:hypothetical protein CEXT_171681 [Caerostris extrusa]
MTPTKQLNELTDTNLRSICNANKLFRKRLPRLFGTKSFGRGDDCASLLRRLHEFIHKNHIFSPSATNTNRTASSAALTTVQIQSGARHRAGVTITGELVYISEKFFIIHIDNFSKQEQIEYSVQTRLREEGWNRFSGKSTWRRYLNNLLNCYKVEFCFERMFIVNAFRRLPDVELQIVLTGDKM